MAFSGRQNGRSTRKKGRKRCGVAVSVAVAALCLGMVQTGCAELPSSFDLRSVDTDGDGAGDRCYVTPVRSQRPMGDCWAFAVTAAAETSLLGSVLQNDPEAYKTLDLSEKQLAYFASTAIDDGNHPQNGEGIRYEALSARFQETKDKYDAVTTEIAQRGIRRREFERFIAELEKLPGAVTEFDEALWGSLVEYVTIKKDKTMVFTMIGGTEIET